LNVAYCLLFDNEANGEEIGKGVDGVDSADTGPGIGEPGLAAN